MRSLTFAEKYTFTSDFSPLNMSLIAQTESKELARKYFFTKYFVPLALTAWYQVEDFSPADKSHCISIELSHSENGLMPILSFIKTITSDRTHFPKEIYEKICRMVFTKHTPDTWLVNHDQNINFDRILHSVFHDCLPEEGKNIFNTMLGSIRRAYIGTLGGYKVSLSIMVKTKDKVPSQRALFNQAVHKSDPLILVNSQKYNKMFNEITGKWASPCNKSSESICAACNAIYNSPAADNAYDDPTIT
jgi:hypothetical protein